MAVLKTTLHRVLPISRGAFAAFVILTLVNIGGFVAVRRQQDRTDSLARKVAAQAVRNCETGNESRGTITDAFDLLITTSLRNPRPDATPEEVERSQELAAKFQRELMMKLGRRDCSKLNVANT